VDWRFLSSFDDVEDCLVAFYKVLRPMVDLCLPLKRVKLRSDDKWWVTPKIKYLLNKKDKAYKKKDHGSILILQKQIDDAIKISMKKLSSEHISKYNSSKKKWSFVKSVSGSRTQRPAITVDLAQQLNDQFCSVFKPEDLHEFDITGYSSNISDDTPLIELFEVDFLLRKIKSLVAGPDCIPGIVFKSFSEFLAEPLTIIFNMSLVQRKIPSVWKMENVIPLPKATNEFRPISLLCVPMKILEKLVLTKWLSPSLKRPFNTAQFAFIPKVRYGGCCNALTLARTWTLKAFDEGAVYVRWLAIDFRKAFDKVSHKKVLTTLAEHFHVSNNLIPWLFDYFSGRMQCVIVDQLSASSFLHCTSGVPQGSILGPVLFAVLLDPCLSTCLNSRVISYADDCTLLNKVFLNQPDLLQGDADLFIHSALEQGLEINAEKCQIISFHRKRSPSVTLPDVLLQSTPVPQVYSIKILGIWFSSDLKWTLHLDHVYKKCSRASYIIKLLHNYGVSGQVLRTVCDALVFSHLTYCWPTFCDCSNYELQKFVLLERRLLKLCRMSFIPGNLRTRLDLQCSRLVKKISAFAGHPLVECFEQNCSTSTIELRHRRKFLPLRAKTSLLRNSFTKFAC
jgi:hypothetical protein